MAVRLTISDERLAISRSFSPFLLFSLSLLFFVSVHAGEWNVEPLAGRGDDCTIRVAPDNVPVVAYERLFDTYSALYLGRRTGGLWYYDLVEFDAYGADIEFDALGWVHVCYVMSGSLRLKYACKTDTGWVYQYIEREAAFGPFFELDPADHPCIAKTDGNHVRYITLEPDGWKVELADSSGDHLTVDDFAMDNGGVAYVLYDITDPWGSSVDVRISQRTDRWSIESILHTTGFGHIEVDSAGRLHLLGGDSDSLRHWVKETGGWQVVSSCLRPGGSYDFKLTRSGHAAVLVIDYRAGVHYVKVATESALGWQVDTVYAVAGQNAVGPAEMDLDSNDQPHIVFYDNNEDRVFYACPKPVAVKEENAERKPARLNLHSSPCRGSIDVSVSLVRGQSASLVLYDLAGRCLSSMPLEPGCNRVLRIARDRTGSLLPAGVYFVRFSANGTSIVRRVVLMR